MADKTVVVRIVLRANQLSSGLKGAATDINRFGVDVERGADKAASSALALGAASATAGKLMLVGIGGALAVSAKASIDFESALAGVAKTTDLAGSAFAKAGSPLAAFGEALRSLSLRTPINVNELAAIAEAGGQLGIEVPNLIEFTEVMAALGVSTNLSATEAASGLARFANIMGTAQDQFGRLGSIIVDLGNNFATTEAEILHFGTRLAPIGKTVGMTEEEVFALSAALTSLGVPAERGGTALQRMFMDMQAAVISGDESLTAFADATRMTREEFATLFQESPAEAFAVLAENLDITNDSGGSALATLRELGIIEQRSIQVILAAANGWETVAESIDMANEAGAEGNALFVEAGRRYGTSASQIQILSNAFNDLRIEVGNALLGSGGLAAGIDFLREFFRIIKDNLPLLGNLARVLATIAATRIAASMFGGLKEGIDKFRALRAGVEGASRATAALSLATLGLNTAVFAAIAVAGILITKWAAAAAKAAELRRVARDLAAEIEAGADPVDALIESLREQEIFTPEFEGMLLNLGLSLEDLVGGIGDADSAFSKLTQGDVAGFLAEVSEMTGKTAEELQLILGGGPRQPGVPRTQGAIVKEIEGIQAALGDAQEIMDAFFENKSNEVRTGLIEAGLGAKFTAEQLKAMADAAVRAADIRVPADSIIASFLTGTPGRRHPGGGVAGQMAEAAVDIERSWQDILMTSESGESKIDDFFDSMADSADDFSGELADSFLEVKETIMGSFPAWDEYEQATIESLDKVIEAQDLYLEDLRDGFNLQEELAGTASERVIEFIENLDPATKAALARYRETNRSGFDQWLTELDGNLAEAGVLTGQFWEQALPGHLEEGFATLVGMARTKAEELGLPGEETAQAFFEGLMEQMSLLPEQHQDAFLQYIAGLFSDTEFLRSMGFDAGDPVVQGFLDALSTLAGRAASVMAEQKRLMDWRMRKELEIGSPSKWAMRLGREIPRGFYMGMEDEGEAQLRRSTFAQSPTQMIPAPMVNVNVPRQPGGRTTNITIVSPRTQDLRGDIQQGLLSESLVGEVEGF